MKNRKKSTVCFTGCRTAKLLRTNNDPNLIEKIGVQLERTIRSLYDCGCTTFLSGMSEGFDLLAAEAVLSVRKECAEIKLIAVIPFMGQELGYMPRDKERYKTIYESADRVVFTSDTYHEQAYAVHRDYLLKNASVVVSFCNDQDNIRFIQTYYSVP